jgi:hypothetical protein
MTFFKTTDRIWLQMVLSLLASMFGAGSALAQFEELAKHVPATTNVLVLLNNDKVLESPAAQAGDWKNKVAEARKAGVTILHPQAKQTVLAMELDLDYMAPLWQAALANWDSEVDMSAIAKRNNGNLDNIGGVAAVELPQDAYVVRFHSQVVGFMTPANRQSAGRWIRDVQDNKQVELSAYLKEAYNFAEVGTPVIVAMDLADAVTLPGVYAKLQQRWDEAGFEGKADMKAVAKVLASIRGVTLGITFKNEPFGALKIDFADDVAPLAPIAKELVLHVLHARGAFINEFEDWKVTPSGKQVRLEGHLTDSGLRRIFSIFDAPPSLKGPGAAETNTNQPQDPQKLMAELSLNYYQAIDGLLKDLKREPARQGNNYSVGSIATWYDNYARKIDNLPILNVDPYLIDFGAQAAKTLRQASQTIKTGGVQAKTAQMNAPKIYNSYTTGTTYGYSYRSNWLGAGYVPYGESYTTNVENVREEQGQAARIRTEYRNKSIFDARTLVDGIYAAMADVRRQLTQKYQIEFK